MDANYWQAVKRAAEDAAEFGRLIGFGVVRLEIKFADGAPIVAITHRETSKRYEDAAQAMTDIERAIGATGQKFTGQQQFTVHYRDGVPARVVATEVETARL